MIVAAKSFLLLRFSQIYITSFKNAKKNSMESVKDYLIHLVLSDSLLLPVSKTTPFTSNERIQIWLV